MGFSSLLPLFPSVKGLWIGGLTRAGRLLRCGRMQAVCRDRRSVLEAIFSLPMAFKLRAHVSLLQLVRETGYPTQQAEIGIDEIKSGIAGREGIVAAWLEHSCAKEPDWGWFFQGPYQGFYLTGSRTRSLEGPLNTCDATEACAYFIKAELDSILGREVRLVRNEPLVSC